MKFAIRVLGFSFVLLFLSANSLYSKSLSLQVRELKDRVVFLEQSLKRLQRDVFVLEQGKNRSKTYAGFIEQRTDKITWNCYLKTKFNTYSGKGITKAQAEGLTLQRCGLGLSCKKKNLTCKSTKAWTKKYIPVNSGKTIVERSPKKIWFCYVQNSLGKTFLGQGDSQISAKASVLKDCSFSCKNKPATCSFGWK